MQQGDGIGNVKSSIDKLPLQIYHEIDFKKKYYNESMKIIEKIEKLSGDQNHIWVWLINPFYKHRAIFHSFPHNCILGGIDWWNCISPLTLGDKVGNIKEYDVN